MVPLIVVLILLAKDNALIYAAGVLFLLASFTDFLDGYLARKNNWITNFGKLMDPLADKLLICSILICLIARGTVPAWAVIVIVAREFAISGFRLVAVEKGVVRATLGIDTERIGISCIEALDEYYTLGIANNYYSVPVMMIDGDNADAFLAAVSGEEEAEEQT